MLVIACQYCGILKNQVPPVNDWCISTGGHSWVKYEVELTNNTKIINNTNGK